MMRFGRLSLCVLAFVVACGRELPSAMPLGGKLDDEEVGAPSNVSADAGATVEVESEDDVEIAVSAPEPGKSDKSSDAVAPATAQAAEKPSQEAAPAAQGAAKAVAKWAGEYVGTDLTTTRFEGLPERVQPDDKARTRVEEPRPGEAVLIVIDSSNGTPLCHLRADTTGTTATIHPYQECFGSDEMTATVIEGSARLEGDRLIFDVLIAAEVEAEDVSLEGEIVYHFDGTRR